MRTRIKFCGLTTAADVALAAAAGADAVGFILAPSPRRISFDTMASLVRTVPPATRAIAVVVDPPEELALAARELGCTLQFSGSEDAATCERLAAGTCYVKALHVAPDAAGEVAAEPFAAFASGVLLADTRVPGAAGGTGRAFPWGSVAALARVRPIAVSGGLTPDNVGACIRTVRPFAVDVRSGIETAGVKDGEKMLAFVRAVRAADAATAARASE